MQLKTRWEQGSNLLMHCYHIASYEEDLFLCAVLIGTAEVRFAIAGGSFFFSPEGWCNRLFCAFWLELMSCVVRRMEI